ncbi:MAG: glycoside hydrolase family 5 protein [Treponema sp.]|nr:glycoside hydrolase family 5 protein [Treponema sp.]
MKKILYMILGITMALAACNSTNSGVSGETETPDAVLCPVPFSRGVNFSTWFESSSAQGIPFTKYVEQDFANVKSLGADVIRLPINMHSMTGGAPDYVFDPLLLKFLDYAVNWAEKYEIYIILDNHSFDPSVNTDANIDRILLKVWVQIAERYKNRSKYVLYEILNEPHGISDQRWGEIQGEVIKAIRQTDPEHTIIVGGTDYNSIGKLAAIPEYADRNLIYTFHFYDPFMFTHQGATWGGPPSMGSLAGVPFPADSKRMPATPGDLRGTWVGRALNNYHNDAAPAKLYNALDKTVAFSRERNVPVFCGEFGVYMIQSPPEDRVRWYEFTAEALRKRNIPRASWDYFGGFGIFNNENGGDFYADLNVGVARAMGFTPPPQRPRSQQAIDSALVIYDDYPARDISVGYWGSETDFSLYDTRTAKGEFAIRWGNAERYNVFWFGFRNGDFSRLAREGYSIEFQARTEKAAAFDIRFINPENASSIPWRMRYTVDEKLLPPDGKWHTIRIALADMQEQGAWVNAKQEWMSPRGKFSWKQIKQMEFVAEDSDLKGRTIWFDSLKIVGP